MDASMREPIKLDPKNFFTNIQLQTELLNFKFGLKILNTVWIWVLINLLKFIIILSKLGEGGNLDS